MTSKPMLSVERELLERIAKPLKVLADKPYRTKAILELRALLDGPEVETSEIKLTGEYHTDVQALMLQVIKLQLAAVDKPADQHLGEAFTYSSKQATNCAGCGLRKHTPLRVDDMGGYVCLTCIDNRLGELLGAERRQVEPVACVISFREGVKEPEILSWNQMSVGEHRLYAEKPAPVAVALPPEIDREYFNDESMAGGWNACRDEAARLNGVKP